MCCVVTAPLFFLFVLFFQKCTPTEEDMMDAVQTAQPAQSSTELTELGKYLLNHEVSIIWPREGSRVRVLALCADFVFVFCQNICMTVLALTFTSLSWKDASCCHRTGYIFCWPFLQQVAFLSALNMYNRDCQFILWYNTKFDIILQGKKRSSSEFKLICRRINKVVKII